MVTPFTPNNQITIISSINFNANRLHNHNILHFWWSQLLSIFPSQQTSVSAPPPSSSPKLLADKSKLVKAKPGVSNISQTLLKSFSSQWAKDSSSAGSSNCCNGDKRANGFTVLDPYDSFRMGMGKFPTKVSDKSNWSSSNRRFQR